MNFVVVFYNGKDLPANSKNICLNVNGAVFIQGDINNNANPEQPVIIIHAVDDVIILSSNYQLDDKTVLLGDPPTHYDEEWVASHLPVVNPTYADHLHGIDSTVEYRLTKDYINRFYFGDNPTPGEISSPNYTIDPRFGQYWMYDGTLTEGTVPLRERNTYYAKAPNIASPTVINNVVLIGGTVIPQGLFQFYYEFWNDKVWQDGGTGACGSPVSFTFNGTYAIVSTESAGGGGDLECKRWMYYGPLKFETYESGGQTYDNEECWKYRTNTDTPTPNLHPMPAGFENVNIYNTAFCASPAITKNYADRFISPNSRPTNFLFNDIVRQTWSERQE